MATTTGPHASPPTSKGLLAVTMTTNHLPAAMTRRPAPAVVENRDGAPSGAPSPRRPVARTTNPVRIGRIGADHIQVAIRPPFGDEELLALVVRLEQLLDAGYDAIDVVFDEGLVSALPETWCERNPDAACDHYVAVKKDADIELSPAQPHGRIARQDVADTVALLHELGNTRQILAIHEDTPITEVVQANVCGR